MQERFAGYSPGMMLVLGADVKVQDLVDPFGPSKNETKLAQWVHDSMGRNTRFSDIEEVLPGWMDENGIRLVKLLGQGGFGQAWEINSQRHGNGLVMKITTHGNRPGDDEVSCVKWIEENQSKQPGGHFKHLPEIFESGNFADFKFHKTGSGETPFFYYIRPMYDVGGFMGEREEEKLTEQIRKETDQVFDAWDVGDRNVGIDKDGNEVYFDPACELKPAKRTVPKGM